MKYSPQSPDFLLQRINCFSLTEKQLINEALAECNNDDFAIGVAGILLDLGLDADCIICVLLQSTLTENNDDSRIKEIAQHYGSVVVDLLLDGKKISSISVNGRTNTEAENIRKMLFAMINDVRVLFIRLADRLQLLRILRDQDEEERKRIASECLDIYAPLADRFGVSWMKDEMEDLSLKQLKREMFTQIKELVALKQVERQKFLDTVRDTLLKEAKNHSIAIAVDSRAKHFYSIYQKMRKRNKRPEEIFDLFGIRILCDSIEACYTALGLVHKLWKPLEGRFKDYIAMPKANGYQSLHTTVITGLDSFASPIEVQIRTFDMHNVAEHGIASHWLYKKGTTNEVVHETYLPVVNKLKNFLQESSTSFLAEMKKEILQDSIFVFTPNGKVIELPAGATAIDFAYAIHSDIGDHCSLAKADGKIISLSCSLQNTQVIEIVASVAAHPHINWLNNVKTAKARNKIKQWLSLNDDAVIAENNLIAKKKKLPQEVTEHTETEVKITQNKTDTNVQVRVQNQKNMLVRFAKCCNPVLGDDIIGFVSRGRGIIIHCKSCKSIKHIKEFDERKIDTEWE